MSEENFIDNFIQDAVDNAFFDDFIGFSDNLLLDFVVNTSSQFLKDWFSNAFFFFITKEFHLLA